MNIAQWLQEEPRGVRQTLRTGVFVWLSMVVFTVCVAGSISVIAVLLGVDTTDALRHFGMFLDPTEELQYFKITPSLDSIVHLSIAAPLEELLFRALPLLLVIVLVTKRLSGVITVAVLSSGVFGWLHGGWGYVPFYGMIGLILSALFLKCGGMRGAFEKPYLVASLTHLAINLTNLAYDALLLMLVR